MSKCKVFLTSTAVVALLTGFARASLIRFSADAPATWNSSGVVITQQISSFPAVTTMTAEFAHPSGVYSAGATYSTFSIHLVAMNDLGWTWTGYELKLSDTGSADFVPGSYSCADFCEPVKDGGLPHPILLTFERSPGDPGVLDGESAHFYFDVRVLGAGSHTFELTQTPIPEPATLALLGIGALTLVTRRKTN
jgi:hypothetical protein